MSKKHKHAAQGCCEKIEPMLQRFVDGELSAEDERYLLRHINECQPCETTSKQLQTVVAALNGLEAVQHPEPDLAYVRSIIDKAQQSERVTPSPFGWISGTVVALSAHPKAVAASVTIAFVAAFGAGSAGIPALQAYFEPATETVYFGKSEATQAPVFVNGATFEPVRLDTLGHRARQLNRTIQIRPVLHAGDPFRGSLLRQQSMSDLEKLLNTYSIDSAQVEILPTSNGLPPSTPAQPVVFAIENMTESGELR